MEKKKKTSTLRLVYAGNPAKKDRIDILVDVMILIKRKCRFDIIGISKEEFLKEYPLYKNIDFESVGIYFRGYMNHEMVIRKIIDADYSCFFRDNNRKTDAGFPTKFSEAITCGTPVITNSTSNISKYFNGNGILVGEVNRNVVLKVLEEAPLGMKTQRDLFDYKKYVDIFSKWINSMTIYH